MLRKAQRRMPFRLQVPTVLERSSDPDTTMPIRVYSMGGHPSVRQVFRMSSGIDYWGVQQTNWEDAPILDKPNTTRFLKGPGGQAAPLQLLLQRAAHAHDRVARERGDPLGDQHAERRALERDDLRDDQRPPSGAAEKEEVAA